MLGMEVTNSAALSVEVLKVGTFRCHATRNFTTREFSVSFHAFHARVANRYSITRGQFRNKSTNKTTSKISAYDNPPFFRPTLLHCHHRSTQYRCDCSCDPSPLNDPLDCTTHEKNGVDRVQHTVLNQNI